MEQDLEDQIKQIKIGFEIKRLFFTDAKIST